MQYPTMTDKEIAAFPIDDFAAPQCALFAWAIHSKLHIMLDIIRDWGFKYSRLITWDKGRGMVINGVANQTEHLIYAYRGRVCIRMKTPVLKSIYHIPPTRHSEKPAEIYRALARAAPPPRIDIFARRRHVGFEAWGNQVEKASMPPLIPPIEMVGDKPMKLS